MSGHSKWANIRVRKGAQDAKRGKIYTRHARLIEIAAQKGGDPGMNASLRVAIDNAKADNVPNANIDRAIKKGTGDLAGQRMEEMMFACYAPGGVACLIECLSDNRNRTVANVKNIVTKHGGSMSETNSVAWMFARKGMVVAKGAPVSDELELELIDAGAEDIDTGSETLIVVTDVGAWTKVRDLLKAKGYEVLEAGLKYVPTQKAPVDAAGMEKLAHFVELLEEDDDVSEVHTNASSS